MLNARHDLLLGSLITPKLVSNHHARHILAALQEFVKELLGRPFVAPALDQDIEYITLLIDSPPQVVGLAADLQEHLIEKSLVSRSGTTAVQLVGIRLPEPQIPLANGFVRYHDATLSQELLDVTVAQRKPVIEPDRVTNDFGRKPEAFVGGGSGCAHAASIACILPVSDALSPT